MPTQQFSRPLFSLMAQIDDVHEEGEHRQSVIDSLAVATIQAFDNSGGAMQRKAPCDGEFADSEAGMLSAVISDNGQMMKKWRQIISSGS